MRWGINLRGDLAKLDDASIASRFETLISEKEKLHQKKPSGWFRNRETSFGIGRGPFHARIFYRMLSHPLFPLFLGLMTLSSQTYSVQPLWRDIYLLDCELKDVRDEIQRRVKRRREYGSAT